MKKAKLLMIAIPIVLTLLFGLGLALTIKYAYIDEIKHYHTAICQINTCTTTSTTCCGSSRQCYTCYTAAVNYTLNLSTNISQSYSKIGSKTVSYSNFCDQNSLDCYYDDRNTQQSLTIRFAYLPTGGIAGIVFLCIVLVPIIVAFVMTIFLFPIEQPVETSGPNDDS